MPAYDLYQLQANPYVTKALDPLIDPGHDGLFVTVDGFGALGALDTYLQGAVAAKKPAFVLVAGRNGTGRSSVANWALARYCKHRGIEAARFRVPHREVLSEDAFDHFCAWFAYLSDEINQLEKVNTQLSDLSLELLTKPSQTEPKVFLPVFGSLANKASQTMSAQGAPPATNPAGFGVCFERVQSYKIVQKTMEIFARTPTIAVFTTLEQDIVGGDVLALFRQAANCPEQIVRLHTLSEQDIATLIAARWQTGSANGIVPPFDPQEVGRRLGQPPRTMARVLWLVANLIERKLLEHGGPAWPGNTNLGYTSDQLERHLRDLETTLEQFARQVP